MYFDDILQKPMLTLKKHQTKKVFWMTTSQAPRKAKLSNVT
jgi:hypothetical protein